MRWENGIFIIDDRPMKLRPKEEIQASIDSIPPDELKRIDAEYSAWAKEEGITLPDLDE